MERFDFDVAVIGAGPAGCAAAVSAKNNGAEKVVLIERDFRLGGILEQCIHMGFGLKYFGEELSGPEYANRFIEMVEKNGVTVLLNTMVLSIESDTRIIHAVNKKGVLQIKAKAIVLTMGCRERTRAQICVPGTRPAGIFTAGTAQRFVNVQNSMIGKKAVIVGSGDIGMIMARRLTLECVKVIAVVEIMPYLAGLTRNRVQCLDDFDIPLYLSHTVTNIRGKYRVEGVSVAAVDEKMQAKPGTEFDIECDTLLFSVGLIPENEVSKTCGIELDCVTGGPIVDNNMQTNVPGIFASGNVLHVNDLVDNVSLESEKAGTAAAKYALGKLKKSDRCIELVAGENVRYVSPQKIDKNSLENVRAYFRVKNPDKDVYSMGTAGTIEVTKVKRQFVRPGEIETIELDINKIIESDTDKVIISIVR